MDIKGFTKMLSDDFDSLKAKTPMVKSATIEQVYDMLMSRRFTEWYLTRFEDHVGSSEPTKNDILVDLKGMLS